MVTLTTTEDSLRFRLQKLDRWQIIPQLEIANHKYGHLVRAEFEYVLGWISLLNLMLPIHQEFDHRFGYPEIGMCK